MNTRKRKTDLARSGHASERCRKIFQRLSDFIDGELPERLCARIQRHMKNCGNCRIFLGTLKKTVELCRKLPAPRLAERPRARILRKIRRTVQAG